MNEHGIVDWILAGLGITASIVCVFISIYLTRHLERRDRTADSTKEEIGKQGDRLNRHTTEIRHLQQQTGHFPFDPNWDR